MQVLSRNLQIHTSRFLYWILGFAHQSFRVRAGATQRLVGVEFVPADQQSTALTCSLYILESGQTEIVTSGIDQCSY